MPEFAKHDFQVLWQTGKYFFERAKAISKDDKHVAANEFIYTMDQAYAAADVVISRAGALSISELCLVGKPTILIPSPNVSEDHQTKNAMALVKNDAAILVKDIEAKENYDAILFAAAPLEVPTYFLDKLSIGGRLVAPIGGGEVQDLSLIKRLSKNKYETEVVEQVLFVPFLGGKVE